MAKVLFLGDASAEKSAIIKRYCYNMFDSSERLTIGVSFHVKTIEHQGRRIKLDIWDFGGEERFRFLLPAYCLGANGAFVLYDITNSKTLESLFEWIQIIRENAGDIPIMLVGTKLHLHANREVSREEGMLIAEKYNLSAFAEVSAKTGQNVEKIFNDFIEILLNKIKEYPIIYVNKCKEMLSKEIKRKFVGPKRRALLKFKPITSSLDISETPYSTQLGLYKNNWALRLYEGNTIIDTYIFKDDDTKKPHYIDVSKTYNALKLTKFLPAFTKQSFPDQQIIVGWISCKIPDISPYQVIEVGQNLVKQAKDYFKRKNEILRLKVRNKIMAKQLSEKVEIFRESVEVVAEKIEYLMKINAVDELVIERKYLPEIFSPDLLGFSQDGLPTLKPSVLKGLFLKGIFTRFYDNVVKFFKGENGDIYPYPYIFKPPEPPTDLDADPQVQVKIPEHKVSKNLVYCQYCGKKFTEEELLTHNCRKKSIK